MKIAQIAPIFESIPPKKYGGTERVVYELTEELVRRGHDVTLFASGDSNTSAKLASISPTTIKNSKIKDPFGFNELSLLHISFAYQNQHQFDIMHDHATPLSLPTASIAETPTVITMHRPFTDTEATKILFENVSDLNLVTISYAQAKMLENKRNLLGTVYNGLDMSHYPFSATHKGYMLFVGRIAERKGPHFAIQASRSLNIPLIIAATYNECDDPDGSYFHKEIKPYLNDQIRWVGEVEERERNELMKNALCVLHPVTWPEPFGLSILESMACGTPVIAFNQGSIPEIIDNGKSGYVVENIQEMIEAIKKVDEIDRNYCKRYARGTYNSKRMADGYEALYERLIIEKESKKNKTRKIYSYSNLYKFISPIFPNNVLNSLTSNLLSLGKFE